MQLDRNGSVTRSRRFNHASLPQRQGGDDQRRQPIGFVDRDRNTYGTVVVAAIAVFVVVPQPRDRQYQLSEDTERRDARDDSSRFGWYS